MTFVEQPSYVWGTDLVVEPAADCLIIRGHSSLWSKSSAELGSRDVFEGYLRAPQDWSSGRTGKKSPHVLFANANSDEEVVAFVKQFGPVVARSIQERFSDAGELPTIIAEQEMDELRRERIVYRSALTLLAGLAQKNSPEPVLRDCILSITDNVSEWPRQYKREQLMRSNDNLPAGWEFDEQALRRMERIRDITLCERPTHGVEALLFPVVSPLSNPVMAGHYVLCELVNAFKPSVHFWGDAPTEGPPLDLRFGIRPVLYFILRQAYVQQSVIGICANTQCRKVFEIERAGSRFCCDVCSRHQRQREYWAHRGKKRRDERNQAKSAKKTMRRGGKLRGRL